MRLYTVENQLDSVAPSHHDDLRDAIQRVIDGLGQAGSVAQQYDAFQYLRLQAVDWFRTLDTTLLGRCNELKAIFSPELPPPPELVRSEPKQAPTSQDGGPYELDFEKASALVIGIAGYTRIRPLPKVDNAKDVAAVLSDKELCGYGQVTILEEEEATKDAILGRLDELAKRPPKTAVLIYFSGHGALIEDELHKGQQYLLPVGAIFPPAAELQDSAISGQEFKMKLSEIAKCTEQLVVILDCCHSGELVDLGKYAKDVTVEKDLKVVRPGLSEGFLEMIGGKAQAVLAAAWKTEKAYVRSGARHGDFTQYLLDGLKGAARGSGGVIRITDLYDYIQERLEKEQEAPAVRATKHKPYFAARYKKNFPIARHLGGV